MAKRFTLQIIMDLASRIGANPAKAISRSNVSFLGKGPTKNPLFQSRLAGLENATEANLGKPETLFAAIDDAVGWMKDGKLNSIQSEILGHNLSGINKILNPPVLPSATVTPIVKGLPALERVIRTKFPKESHKFFGRPLKDKDFSEIDRMVMEGKIPDARGRKWNLKTPETGPFQGWTPSVVPKANIPASKINHQIIADKYGINVELIEGKDWVEVLEILRKLGYAEGGLAGILQVPTKKAAGGRIGFAKGKDWKSKIGSFFSNLGWSGMGEDFRRTKEQFKARNLTEGDEHLRYFKAMDLPHSDNFLKDLAESWAIANTTRDKEEIWNKYKRWLEMENFERANIAKGGLAGILEV